LKAKFLFRQACLSEKGISLSRRFPQGIVFSLIFFSTPSGDSGALTTQFLEHFVFQHYLPFILLLRNVYSISNDIFIPILME